MTLPILRRDLLSQALGGNLELISAFEQLWQAAEALIGQMEAVTGTTDAAHQAGVLTTSATSAFGNSRVLAGGEGVELVDDGSTVTVKSTDLVPKLQGGFLARFVVTSASHLVLPPIGTLATVAGAETFSNKTLAAPKLSDLGNYANDAAAATGGVAVGSVYRNGSAVMVRVT
jgi:hypothetical protein